MRRARKCSHLPPSAPKYERTSAGGTRHLLESSRSADMRSASVKIDRVPPIVVDALPVSMCMCACVHGCVWLMTWSTTRQIRARSRRDALNEFRVAITTTERRKTRVANAPKTASQRSRTPSTARGFWPETSSLAYIKCTHPICFDSHIFDWFVSLWKS